MKIFCNLTVVNAFTFGRCQGKKDTIIYKIQCKKSEENETHGQMMNPSLKVI